MLPSWYSIDSIRIIPLYIFVLMFLVIWLFCFQFYMESLFTIYVYCLLLACLTDSHHNIFVHVYLSMHTTWHTFYVLVGLHSDNHWICMSRSQNLNRGGLPVIDQSGTAVNGGSAIARPKPFSSIPSFSVLKIICCNSWAPYVLFIFVHLLVNHLFAPLGNVIFL